MERMQVSSLNLSSSDNCFALTVQGLYLCVCSVLDSTTSPGQNQNASTYSFSQSLAFFSRYAATLPSMMTQWYPWNFPSSCIRPPSQTLNSQRLPRKYLYSSTVNLLFSSHRQLILRFVQNSSICYRCFSMFQRQPARVSVMLSQSLLKLLLGYLGIFLMRMLDRLSMDFLWWLCCFWRTSASILASYSGERVTSASLGFSILSIFGILQGLSLSFFLLQLQLIPLEQQRKLLKGGVSVFGDLLLEHGGLLLALGEQLLLAFLEVGDQVSEAFVLLSEGHVLLPVETLLLGKVVGAVLQRGMLLLDSVELLLVLKQSFVLVLWDLDEAGLLVGRWEKSLMLRLRLFLHDDLGRGNRSSRRRSELYPAVAPRMRNRWLRRVEMVGRLLNHLSRLDELLRRTVLFSLRVVEVRLVRHFLGNMEKLGSLRLALGWNVLECKSLVGMILFLSPLRLPVLLLQTYIRVCIFQERVDLVGCVPYWIFGRLDETEGLSFAMRLTAIIILIVNDWKSLLRWALCDILRPEPNLSLAAALSTPVNISHRLLSIKHDQIRLAFSLPLASQLPVLLEAIGDLLRMKGVMLVGECELPAHFITIKWYKSYVCEQNIIGSLVPIVLLPVVVGSWTWHERLLLLKTSLLALEDAVVLQELQFSLLAVFLLDLLDDVIIIVVLLLLGEVFESSLANAEAWLLDDQIRVFFLFLNDTSCDIVVDEVVASNCRFVLLFFYELAVDFRLEG